ncbi:MAG: histidinol-phosphate transaminase [Planctomycetales bacterium]|nr:histidinol-phosphate transaminase [Planctomycetales bacterium]NIM09531.1 histidinol-phosphate transaminase [Planctomycetales bacterium]NIN07368.1 histidinol-phosphate transaminase [Planctomycetales bacterium]NIN76472.1 histidinol-phosphate transaminase [Planctomycetales bacterium]NIO35319.1 histidinol-phosphate transaminase [Planctomycetales bacterium]
MSYFRDNIEAMAAYVPGEQPQGGKFIKLNTNENPYAASPAVARAIQSVLQGGLSRYPDPLANAFRRRAAALHQLSPDWILCGNGSDDILTIVTRAMVGERGGIRSAYPSYLLYHTLAEIQGAQFEQFPFRPDWSLDDSFALAADNLRLVFLANPNSPSGTMLPPDRIAELATQLPCPLLVDEAYVDFAQDDCVRLVAQHENVMVSRSLSKAYALAGLRFGYLIAQPQIISGLAKVKDSYNCDSLSIAAATAAIDDQTWRMENRASILGTRQRLTAALRDLDFAVTDSQANFVWAVHPQAAAKTLFEQLKASQILVRYMHFPNWGDGLRISVGTNSQIDALLDVLGR